MALDPTQRNRDALASAARKVLPSKSPLSKSLEEQDIREQEQLAIDEANNYITPRPAVNMPMEIQKAVDPSLAIKDLPVAPEGSFVNPNAVVAQESRTPANTFLEPMAPNAPAVPMIPNQTAQIDQAVANYENMANETGEKVATLQEQKAQAIQAKMDEDDKNVDKIEPRGFFHGKSTWQKVLGGIGLFLGSITPEGARNVANIIDKEIERDIDAQKTNIKLKQDKNDKSFARLIERYGSQESALLAKKKDAFSLLGIHLQKLQLNAKNDETRARLRMGMQEIEMKKQAIGNDLMKSMLKQQEKAIQGKIPGYTGAIEDATASRQFKDQISELPGVLSEIKNLKTINEKFLGGTLSPSARASAQQSQTLLIGKMRVALIGPGTVNESEYKLLRDAISNPTDFFSLGSSNELKLNKLETAYLNKIDANARAFGLEKELPRGVVREIE